VSILSKQQQQQPELEQRRGTRRKSRYLY